MFLETIHQKKSALFTTVIMCIVLFLMFFSGLSYVDTPEEYGVAVNFGTSDIGSGPPSLNKSIKSNPDVEELEESAPQEQEEIVKETFAEEEVVTQDIEEAPSVIEKVKPKAQPKKVIEKVKEVKKEIKKVKPKPNKATQSALSNLFGKKTEGDSATSEGDDDSGNGVKGKLNGDPNSNNYYGNNGFGGTGNYSLRGRKVRKKPIKKPTCNEEGIVVVRVEVDSSGNVIYAEPGVKGTTNHSSCLLKPAKEAALLTKWNGDENAPTKQVGYIRYQFTLSQ